MTARRTSFKYETEEERLEARREAVRRCRNKSKTVTPPSLADQLEEQRCVNACLNDEVTNLRDELTQLRTELKPKLEYIDKQIRLYDKDLNRIVSNHKKLCTTVGYNECRAAEIYTAQTTHDRFVRRMKHVAEMVECKINPMEACLKAHHSDFIAGTVRPPLPDTPESSVVPLTRLNLKLHEQTFYAQLLEPANPASADTLSEE